MTIYLLQDWSDITQAICAYGGKKLKELLNVRRRINLLKFMTTLPPCLIVLQKKNEKVRENKQPGKEDLTGTSPLCHAIWIDE